MRENLQNGLMVLRRKLGPMKALILVELFAALALVLYINGVFSSGPKAEVGGMLLMGFVLTFLQPKTQFGLVWTWQDKIRELSTAPLEDMGEGSRISGSSARMDWISSGLLRWSPRYFCCWSWAYPGQLPTGPVFCSGCCPI